MEYPQSYEVETQSLRQRPDKKIQKIIDCGCLQRISGVCWICKPIAGYNKTTYTLSLGLMNGLWHCDCQGFANSKTCSHVKALKKKLSDGKGEQSTLFGDQS